MNIRDHISLKPYNTFGIEGYAGHFAEIHSLADLEEAGRLPYPRYVLGGGSNILLTQPVTGIVLHNCLKGKAEIQEDDNHIWLEVQAGEIWHELVMYTIANGWGGLENLALIPGTVGASPMQNIGAYGVEAKDTIESVSCWLWDEGKLITLSNDECRFGYRDSIFKNGLKDKVFITSVVYKLSKKPVFNTSYGAIEQELQAMGVTSVSVEAIAAAVIRIRTSKLPDPKEIGNAGSFFKNPTIPVAQYEALKAEYPVIPCYIVSNKMVKVPAGWLIEQCGWKGYRAGALGVHARQALVLVNYGGAAGADIWHLSGEIVQSVHTKFGIDLEREVQVW